MLVLYLLQRAQSLLPLDNGMRAVGQGSAWNTAVSFVTNTNWQGYSGESTMGHLVQMAGLAVQNFLSAAVGIAVAIALVRGLRPHGHRPAGQLLGRPHPGGDPGAAPDLGRRRPGPGAGRRRAEPQRRRPGHATLSGRHQFLPGGPVASQEAIKELGTNGGGFYNANAAHPFEGPTAWISLFQIFLLLVIPFALPRTFGRMVGDKRQGFAILGVMAGTRRRSRWRSLSWARGRAPGGDGDRSWPARRWRARRSGSVGRCRCSSPTRPRCTSTGAVNSLHDSFTPFGGGVAMVNMMLGEVAPGGVGSGLYGMLVLAVITVFVAGLMVGRTPEYLGKKLGRREMTLSSLYILTTPALVLIGTGIAMALPAGRSSMLNSGPHGLSEVLYAFTSAANNNGSAFAGLSANVPFYNVALGLAMAFGRFLPIVFVLALAGRLAAQGRTPANEGTFPTHRPLFVGLLFAVVLVVVGLTYFPALSLGPLAEGL